MKRETAVAKHSAKPMANRRKRHARGRTRAEATFPVAPSRAGVAGRLRRDARRHQAAGPDPAPARGHRGERGDGAALLGHRPHRSSSARRNAGWGAKVIDRLVRGSARGLPRHAGVLAAQPQVHASVCGGLARCRNCAAGRCTIALAPEHACCSIVSTTPRRASGTREQGTRARLVARHPQPPDRQPRARAARQGDQQLRDHPAAGRLRHGRAGLQGSLPVRLPRHRRSAPRARGRAGARRSHPAVPARARHRLRVRRPPGPARGRRPGLLPRPPLLSPEASLLRRHRAEGRPVRPGLRRSAQPLPVGGRRPAAPPRRQADDRPLALPLEEQARRRVRPARPRQARSASPSGRPGSSRQLPDGSRGQPADGRADRGRARETKNERI